MRADEYAKYDGLGLAKLVQDKEITAEELAETAYEAIERTNDQLNFMVADTRSEAEKNLRNLDQTSPFAGVPTLIKDIGMSIAGVPMEMGCELARGLVPQQDSEITKRFRHAGFVFIGRTTTPELASAFVTEPRTTGITRNPWDLTRTPGGSSGGAAAAVAAGAVPLAHGGDAGGSIRVPSHCCGLFGLKPTRARTPVGPEAAEINSGCAVTHVLSRTIRDSAAALDALAGPDVGCRYFAPPPSGTFLDAAQKPRSHLRIAVCTDSPFGGSVSDEVNEAIKSVARVCEDLGHRVIEAFPPVDGSEVIQILEVIWSANLYHSVGRLAALMGRKLSADTIEASTAAFYERGKKVSVDEFLGSLDQMNQFSRRIGQFFADYDVLLTPTLTKIAPQIGEANADAPVSDLTEYFWETFRVASFTAQYNLTGQPAMSIPLSQSSEGLPIGSQFIGRLGEEETLLSLAGQLESSMPWSDRRPAISVFDE